MDYERKVEQINLFNRKLLIGERNAFYVMQLGNFSKKFRGKNDFEVILFEQACVISDALKVNITRLKFYQIFKKIYYKWLLRPKRVLKLLPPSSIFEIATKVYKLEGVKDEDFEKKNLTLSQAQN